MILDSLKLCDFRSYGGFHEILLTPRVKYGVERPIILFGGLNGSVIDRSPAWPLWEAARVVGAALATTIVASPIRA